MALSVTPSSQTVGAGSPATISVQDGGASFGDTFADAGGGGTFSPTSGPVNPGGFPGYTFTYANSTPGTYTVTVTPGYASPPDAPVSVTVIVGATSAISPGAETIRVNSNSILTLVLRSDTPTTSVTFSDGGGGGVFNPVSMGALSADADFTYLNSTPGVYTVTATINGAWGSHTASCTVTVLDTYRALYSFSSQTTGTNSAIAPFEQGTGIVNSAPGDTFTCITIDNGGSQGFTSFNGRVAFSWTPSEVWEYSASGISWTTFVPTASVSYTPGAGVYSEVDVVWTPSSTITARYVRMTFKDHPSASQVSTAGVISLAIGAPATGGGGSLSLSGTLTRTDGSPWSNMQVSICIKTAIAPETRAGGTFTLPNRFYCSDGNWTITQVTTDCSGAWSYASGAGNIRAVNVFLGPMRVNPHFDKNAAFNDGTGTYGWPNWAYLIPDNSVAEWAHVFYNNSNGAAHTSTGTLISGWSFVGISTGHDDSSGGIGCGGVPNSLGTQMLAGPSIGAAYGGYKFFTNEAVFVSGSFTLNTVIGGAPIVYFVAKAFGNYYDIGHPPALPMIDAVIADSCSHSGHVSEPGVDWILPNTIDWWLINSVTGITFNTGFDCSHLSAILSCPHFDISSAVQIYPSNQLHSPVQTERYNADYNSVNPALSYKHKTLMVLVEDCTSTPDMPLLSATTFDGALNVAWVSGAAPALLKTRVHLGPSRVIGASTVLWENIVTIETAGVSGCGIVYLPQGRLILVYDLSGDGKYRYNDQRGTGSIGTWSAALRSTLHNISAGGVGQEQGFAFLVGPSSLESNVVFYQCRDGQGANWTTPVIAVGGARGPLCGGVWLGNQYGLLYTGASNKVCFISTSNPSTWPAGTGADTTFTGNVCGMAKHPSGRLVGLTQAGVGGAVKALISNDQGLTWTQVGLSITPTPPPVIVEDCGILYAVYIESDAPKFMASVDGGASWT